MKTSQTSQKPSHPHYQVCRVCGYDRNQNNATHCEACKLSLLRRTISEALANVPALLRGSSNRVTTFTLLFVLLAAGLYYLGNQMAKQDNSVPSQTENSNSSTTVGTEGLQPLLADSPDFQSRYIWMREVPHAPIGTFNYGGFLAKAAMTNHGINTAIAKAYPKFNLRYTELLNEPPGCSTGILVLLESELSFAQNGRPL